MSGLQRRVVGIARHPFAGSGEQQLKFEAGQCLVVVGKEGEWLKAYLVDDEEQRAALCPISHVALFSDVVSLLRHHQQHTRILNAVRAQKKELQESYSALQQKAQLVATRLKGRLVQLTESNRALESEVERQKKMMQRLKSAVVSQQSQLAASTSSAPSLVLSPRSAEEKRLRERLDSLLVENVELKQQLEKAEAAAALHTEEKQRDPSVLNDEEMQIFQDLWKGAIASSAPTTPKGSASTRSMAQQAILGTASASSPSLRQRSLSTGSDDQLPVVRPSVNFSDPATFKCPTFGQPLSAVVARDGTDVPLVVRSICDYLMADSCEGLKKQGLFRAMPTKTKVQSIKFRINMDTQVDLEELGVTFLEAGELLKTFLRELPESVLSSRLLERWICAAYAASPDMQIPYLRTLLIGLSDERRALVSYLSNFFSIAAKYEAQSGLTSKNLAKLFGPLFLCRPEEDVEEKKDRRRFRGSIQLSFSPRMTRRSPKGSPRNSPRSAASSYMKDLDAGARLVQCFIDCYHDIFDELAGVAQLELYQATCSSSHAKAGMLSISKGDIVAVFEKQGRLWSGECRGEIGKVFGSDLRKIDVT